MSDLRINALRIVVRARALPADQRDTFIQNACGADDDLGREVRLLLGSFDRERAALVEEMLGSGPEPDDEFLEQAARRTAEQLQAALDLTPGRRLLGRYTVVKQIAVGGMAEVYWIREDGFDRDLAIKVIKPELHGLPAWESRFLTEARLTGQLQHPNIVPVHSMGRLESGRLYFTMKLVKGDTLATILAAQEPSEEPGGRLNRLLQIFERVCEALELAHVEGVVHRDLKPSNVMVGASGEVQLMDWGIAKVLRPSPGALAAEAHPDVERARDAAGGRQLGLPEAGQVLGTLAYIAPEQARGEVDRISPRTDVFGLGAILCEVLTGTPPYRWESGDAAYTTVALQRAQTPDLGEALQRLEVSARPARLVEMAKACLAVNPEDRPSDAAAVRNHLRDHFDAERRETEQAKLDNAAALARAYEAEKRAQAEKGERLQAERREQAEKRERLQAERREQAEKRVGRAKGVILFVGMLAVVAFLIVGVVVILNGQLATAKGDADHQRDIANQAKADADHQRDIADQAKEDADHQRDEANRLRGVAEEQKRLANHFRYASDMNLAERSWEEGDVTRVMELLDGQRPERPEEADLRGWEWYHLWWRCSASHLTIPGYRSGVHAVAFHPDGRLLASASSDRVILRDLYAGTETYTLLGHSGQVTAVAFSHDGQRLVSGGSDHALIVWDPLTGKQVRSLKGHTNAITGVAFSADGRYLASSEMNWDDPGPAEVKIWDTQTWTCRWSLKIDRGVQGIAFDPKGRHLAAAIPRDNTGRAGEVWLWTLDDDGKPDEHLVRLTGGAADARSVAFSPFGDLVSGGAVDGVISIWDLKSGMERVLCRHGSLLHQLVFSRDGKRLASVGEGSVVQVWDFATGEKLHSLKGHTHAIYAAAFSPEGHYLASGSADRTVKIWDLGSPQEGAVFSKEGDGDICGLAFSADNQTLLSVNSSGKVRVRDWVTGKEIQAFQVGEKPVFFAVSSADGARIALSMADAVEVWDVSTCRRVHRLTGHQGQVSGLAFSPDGDLLASAGYDQTVRVWDMKEGKQTHLLKGHTKALNSVAFSIDGRSLASGADDFSVIVWDVAAGTPRLTLRGHPAIVESVGYSRDGKYLAAACGEGTIRLWDAVTGTQVRDLRGHTTGIFDLAFSSDYLRLVTGSLDKTVKVWDMPSGLEVCTLRGNSEAVTRVAFSADGVFIASGGQEGTVRLWQAPRVKDLPVMRGHAGKVWGVAISPDGKNLASCSEDRTVRIWDAVTGRELITFKGHGESALGVAFSPDGRRVASGDRDGQVKVWEASTGREIYSLVGHDGPVRSLAFSPDGNRLASASIDQTVRLWDLQDGRQVLKFTGHKEGVMAVAFCPDGKHLVSGSVDKTVRFWDGTTGDEIWSREQADMVLGVAVDQGGTRVASCGSEGMVIIRNLLTGETIHELDGDAMVACVAFSPRGDRLAAVGLLHEVQEANSRVTGSEVVLWDTDTGHRVVVLPQEPRQVTGLAFGPDGQWLATSGSDKLIRVWDVQQWRLTLPSVNLEKP